MDTSLAPGTTVHFLDLVEALTDYNLQSFASEIFNSLTTSEPHEVLVRLEELKKEHSARGDSASEETLENLKLLVHMIALGRAAYAEQTFPACPSCGCNNVVWASNCSCSRRDCGCYAERSGDFSLI